ncbi:glycosyltransferase [Jejudonia soesokkakensis]|uniref:Glycosyltransferase n=1 Tax=Jejudonia soesokkakensis TaxID=1323432 RepID=A0ABW2MTB6_9FLAO
MMQLISIFKERGYTITFASTASISEKSQNLEELGISSETIELNSSSFDVFVKKLEPTIVLFDRYITEEQFGWRVAQMCPEALRILDTEDLHFLRKARQEAVKNNIPVTKAYLFTETAKREIASILRCDLSLIISEVEMQLLKETFKISEAFLLYLPFLIEPLAASEKLTLPTFDERHHFVTIGNMFHAPNVDSVLQLKKEIWPQIKKRLPKAELHVYGTYASQQIIQLHSKKEGFLIKGWAPSVREVMTHARVCVAPIRFGAGLKGKLIDAMQFGTPFVTTQMGAEGIFTSESTLAYTEDNNEKFVDTAVTLYSNKKDWLVGQRLGFATIESRFRKKSFEPILMERIKHLLTKLSSHRNQNFIGQVLQHHTLQSSKYLSKWIEEKNKASGMS